jgi:two-component system, chemotaxis family, chemotaxis protein CheY
MRSFVMSTVLILDTTIIDRRTTAKIVREGGYQVVEATSAEKALEIVHHQDPSCLIVDQHVPDMDCLELLDVLQLKKNGIPIIILSKEVKESTKAKCLEHGAIGVLRKPPDKEILLAVMKKIIN